MDIGQKLRNARKVKGLTQVEVANALGVTQGAVRQWEAGATTPSAGKLSKVADLLDIPVAELLAPSPGAQVTAGRDATVAVGHGATEGLRLARVAEPTRTILTLDQTRALLAHAQAHATLLLPYLPLCLFAGLRPDEAKRLRPEHLGPEYITLTPAITKTASARTVPIRPNLRAWLARYPLPDDGATHGLSKDRFKKHLTALAKAADIHWVQDILRHSFASYAYEASRDASATAYEMGHTGTDIFFRHYRGLVHPGDGQTFFNIFPT